MTTKYEKLKEQILTSLNKYKDNVDVGDYILIKDNLDEMEKRFNETSGTIIRRNQRIEDLKQANRDLLEGDDERVEYWKKKAQRVSFFSRLKGLFGR